GWTRPAGPSTRRCTTHTASSGRGWRPKAMSCPAASGQEPAMADQHVRPTADLLRSLLGPADPELTCDACFEELDRYVELEIRGADADAAVPGMRAHLEGCPA